MALSEKEGTKKEVMDLFTMPGGFKAGYVMIKHVEIQYQNNSVNLLIGKYASEEARRENIDNCVHEFVGFPVTDLAMEFLAVSDDRAVFYPYLEAQIQFLALSSQQTDEKNLDNLSDEVYTDTVQAIYDSYNIENPYAPKAETAE